MDHSSMSDYMAHGFCFLWEPHLVWLHVISDILTGISYYAIPVSLSYFLLKRRDVPFLKMFVLFGVFVFACGTTHFLAAYTIYVPAYWSEGVVKAITALVSVISAILFIPLIPKAIAMPSLAKTMQSLRKSEERHRTILQTAMDGFWMVDKQGHLLEVNDTFCRTSGYSEQELLNMNIPDLAASETKEDTAAHIEKILARGEDRFESRHRRKDGSIVDVLVSAQSRPTDDGLIVAFLQDITERKRSENALRDSEENYRRSLDESPLGIRIVSQGGETLYLNRATLDIFAYDSIGEWQTIPTVKRYTEQSYAEFEIRREKRRLNEDESSEYEIDIVRKSGEVRHLQVFRKRVRWDGKEHSQVIYRDITEHKQAEKHLQETLDSLRVAVNTTIQVMVSAVETRDPYTAGHQLRSADLARAIATEMGLSSDKIEGLRLAGSIHDIGKLSIPAEILSKPTKLSEIEFSLIKEHAKKGYEMLKEVKSPWPLAEIIHQHHEWMDGSGYPRNLQGDEILMEARILTVADVVEAMASHRPYRPALGIELALAEIEKNRGIFYDNAVADACLRLFREKGFQLAVT